MSKFGATSRATSRFLEMAVAFGSAYETRCFYFQQNAAFNRPIKLFYDRMYIYYMQNKKRKKNEKRETFSFSLAGSFG